MSDVGLKQQPLKKARYHHGDLREALIDAARDLICAYGVDSFKVADACKAAGVSTAAPYRHFADRDALIDAVAARGFEELAARLVAARDAHEPGSIDAIIAMGQSYVAFVSGDPELFELMWMRAKSEAPEAVAQTAGHECFGSLLEAVDAFKLTNGLEHIESNAIALPMWTMVHGTASLVLGERLSKMAPEMSIDQLVADTTRTYFAGVMAEANPARR